MGSYLMGFALIFELTEKEDSATGRGLSEKGLEVKEHNITNHTKQILILIMLVSTQCCPKDSNQNWINVLTKSNRYAIKLHFLLKNSAFKWRNRFMVNRWSTQEAV